jgi:hypothetical protein
MDGIAAPLKDPFIIDQVKAVKDFVERCGRIGMQK